MILVTGASGNVGGKVASHLIASGQPTRVLSRNLSHLARIPGSADKVVGDLHDPQSLERALEGVDGIFLLTADTVSDQNVLSVGARTGLKHIVKLSTQEAGWTPVEGHGHWHHEREKLIQASGIGWTFPRPTMFMSASLAWVHDVKTSSTVRYPGGDGRLASIDPDDVAAVAAVCLTQPDHQGKGYELTGPQLLSFSEMTEILSRVIEKTLSFVSVSEEQYGPELVKSGLPDYVVKGLLETFGLIRKGRFAYTTDNVQTILRRPANTFEHWCRANSTAFV